MVSVDKNKCIGCCSCASICGDVFEMTETDSGIKARVRPKADTSKPCIKEAINICPVEAIS